MEHLWSRVSTETSELRGTVCFAPQIETYFYKAGIMGHHSNSSQRGIIKFISITQQEAGKALILVPVPLDRAAKTAKPP